MSTGAVRYEKFSTVVRQLRRLSYAYIALVLLEGALRKWFLTGFSDLLLLVRDPIVLAAYGLALSTRKFPKNHYVVLGILLMVVWSITTLLFGHQNITVTIFGIRANYLHFPMAFVMASVFYRSDVIQIGRWWLIGTLVMTVIIVLQFTSPQSAWINQGVGGVGSAGFSGAMGRFRPPGTFSFIVGVVWFYTFAVAFIMAGILQHNRYPKWLLLSAAIAILIAIPVSISRTLILSAALTVVVSLFASSLQKNALLRYLKIGVFTLIAIAGASQFPVFDDAKEAFFERWETSTSDDYGGIQGAIIWRITNEFTGPFLLEEDIPFFGQGIGAGTQVGAQVLSGTRGFQLGEGEWFRLTAEGGLLIGGLYILWRIALCIALFKYSLISFSKGNGLGFIFLSATAYNLLVGQLGQSTILGFTVIGIALTAASMRERKIVQAPSESAQNQESIAQSA